jgi:hypothetical protein
MDPMTMQLLMGMVSGGGGGQGGGGMSLNPLKMAGQAAGAIGGAVQMAVGYAQLAKAKKLPFPNYTDGMQYANENMDMYRRQYREGMGQNVLGGIRKETTATTAKTMRSLAETTPQFAGQEASRMGALDRMTTEATLSKLDAGVKKSAVGGMTKAAADISEIQQRQVKAERDYKIQAQEAAGNAIATGSENLVQGIQYLSS